MSNVMSSKPHIVLHVITCHLNTCHNIVSHYFVTMLCHIFVSQVTLAQWCLNRRMWHIIAFHLMCNTLLCHIIATLLWHIQPAQWCLNGILSRPTPIVIETKRAVSDPPHYHCCCITLHLFCITFCILKKKHTRCKVVLQKIAMRCYYNAPSSAIPLIMSSPC